MQLSKPVVINSSFKRLANVFFPFYFYCHCSSKGYSSSSHRLLQYLSVILVFRPAFHIPNIYHCRCQTNTSKSQFFSYQPLCQIIHQLIYRICSTSLYGLIYFPLCIIIFICCCLLPAPEYFRYPHEFASVLKVKGISLLLQVNFLKILFKYYLPYDAFLHSP